MKEARVACIITAVGGLLIMMKGMYFSEVKTSLALTFTGLFLLIAAGIMCMLIDKPAVSKQLVTEFTGTVEQFSTYVINLVDEGWMIDSIVMVKSYNEGRKTHLIICHKP